MFYISSYTLINVWNNQNYDDFRRLIDFAIAMIDAYTSLLEFLIH